MRERELRQPVHEWLTREARTKVMYEVLMAGYCDMVAVLFAQRTGRLIPLLLRITAVELKLSDVAGVIKQAEHNRWHVHASYAAMPLARCRRMLPATVQKFRASGVGLLSVGPSVEVLVEPSRPVAGLDVERYRKRFWRRILRNERSAEME